MVYRPEPSLWKIRTYHTVTVVGPFPRPMSSKDGADVDVLAQLNLNIGRPLFKPLRMSSDDSLRGGGGNACHAEGTFLP